MRDWAMPAWHIRRLHPAEEWMNDLPLRPAADIGAVEDRFFTLRDFPLADGTVMAEATIAYETYGRLAPDGRNAILCTHGYTGSRWHNSILAARAMPSKVLHERGAKLTITC